MNRKEYDDYVKKTRPNGACAYECQSAKGPNGYINEGPKTRDCTCGFVVQYRLFDF